jgi:hypothetical protein
MTRRFHSRAGNLPPEAVLASIGVGAAAAALFGVGGPYGAATLVEVAGAAFATAAGIKSKRPWLAGLIGAALAFPVATAVCVATGWSSC